MGKFDGIIVLISLRFVFVPRLTVRIIDVFQISDIVILVVRIDIIVVESSSRVSPSRVHAANSVRVIHGQSIEFQ